MSTRSWGQEVFRPRSTYTFPTKEQFKEQVTTIIANAGILTLADPGKMRRDKPSYEDTYKEMDAFRDQITDELYALLEQAHDS